MHSAARDGYPGVYVFVSFIRWSVFQAFSGNPIRINLFPSDLDNIVTANCRLVTAVDEATENSILHYIDNIIEEVRGSIYDYLVEHDKKFSKFLSGKQTQLLQRVVTTNKKRKNHQNLGKIECKVDQMI